MSQKQQFNAELYFANPQAWTLETRDGVKIPKDKLEENKSSSIFAYKYLHPDSKIRYRTITEIGQWGGSSSKYDLFMIPLATDIPFTLEDFNTGNYDVVWNDWPIIAAFYDEANCRFSILAKGFGACNTSLDNTALKLRPRPISPFTHPELYEVSDNLDGTWFDIVKYYDFIENREVGSHTVLMKNGSTLYYPHLRLKDQPTIITQQQADEAIKDKYPNYKIQG